MTTETTDYNWGIEEAMRLHHRLQGDRIGSTSGKFLSNMVAALCGWSGIEDPWVLQKLWERVETKKDSFGARTEFHTGIWGGQNDIEQIQNQVWLPVKICDDWRKGRFVHVDTAIMRYYDKQFMPGLFSRCTINNTMGLEKNERRRDETRHNEKYEDARQFTTAPSKPRTLFDSDLKTLATYQTGIAALWGPLFHTALDWNRSNVRWPNYVDSVQETINADYLAHVFWRIYGDVYHFFSTYVTAEGLESHAVALGSVMFPTSCLALLQQKIMSKRPLSHVTIPKEWLGSKPCIFPSDSVA